MIDTIVTFLQQNPLLVLMICFLLYKQYQARQPWPDFGGRITVIESVEQWNKLLAECAASNKVVVVDAYATWCPPCKSAAPVYAKMSEEYSADSCVFAKFNVDHVREMGSLLGISAMCARRAAPRRAAHARTEHPILPFAGPPSKFSKARRRWESSAAGARQAYARCLRSTAQPRAVAARRPIEAKTRLCMSALRHRAGEY
jgi:thiol-disulfide isomerase/thioredoxin